MVAGSSRHCTERRFPLATGTLAALHFPPTVEGAPRVLALHGWLDNAASFTALANALPEFEVLALDLAGHGRSDWRPPAGSYALVDHLPELQEVLDALEWSSCALLGHSMGAAIASLFAVAAPERVDRLICIDALGPLSLDEAEAAARLRRALSARREPRPRRRLFPGVKDACLQRAELNGVSAAAIAPLVERGLTEVENGWIWAADPRLQLPSAIPMSEAQVQQLLRALSMPVLVLAADTPDPRLPRLHVQARLDCVPQVQCVRLPGGHHLHLAETARTATEIRRFFASGQATIG
ncbi:alpha/beta fold hydrolase [Aquimonas voraii]|uniref:Epoxide hydrolase. Serine peptidase. MEROPS family S33 n=1 Tax=Aquimonas voraii TaxID=265719 RepID=A0A1G6UFL8_9GAMM|nr:alpha/beta fold hydrolase [Aquimonas voraii]SDD40162.1 epoxide hydrolase. Serine peptidase. MEROPS family S33 [Aquimonas voraii]